MKTKATPILNNINKTLEEIVKDVATYKGKERSKLAAFIWWRICEGVDNSLSDSLKGFISYKKSDRLTDSETQNLLLEFGFFPDYVQSQLKSTINESYRRSLVGRS